MTGDEELNIPERIIFGDHAAENSADVQIRKLIKAIEVRLGHSIRELSPAKQSLIFKTLSKELMQYFPKASIGNCHCGNELRYKGTDEGLFICCTGIPEHCYNP